MFSFNKIPPIFYNQRTSDEGSRPLKGVSCSCLSWLWAAWRLPVEWIFIEQFAPNLFYKMGNYVNQNLIKDEEVIYEGVINKILCVIPVVLLVVYCFGWTTDDVKDRTMELLSFPFAAVFLAALVYVVGVLKSEIAITNKRVIAKHGIISTHTLELNLQKIESVGISQGAIGSMFGFGTIIIKGTGGTSEAIGFINNPFEFRKRFQEAFDKVNA